MDNVAIGRKIKEFRKLKNMTQKDLAISIGRTESSIRKYEKGLVEIPNSILEQIAEKLDVIVQDLLPWTDIPEIRDAVYAADLEYLNDFIQLEYFQYSEKEIENIKNEIDNYISEGNKIEDLELRKDYFHNIKIKYTHKLLDHTLKPLKNEDVFVISSMIAQYLYMNSNAQSKITEYIDDLYGNPLYHKQSTEED